MRQRNTAARAGAPMAGSLAAHAAVLAVVAGVYGWSGGAGSDQEPPVVRIAAVVEFAAPRPEAAAAEVPEPAVQPPRVVEAPLAPEAAFDLLCREDPDAVEIEVWPRQAAFEGPSFPGPRVEPAAEPAPPPPAVAPAVRAAAPAPPPLYLPPSVDAAGCPPPEYPIRASRLRHEGVTVLLLRVGPDGGVLDASVADSSGHAELDEAAIEAARGWRLKPATRDGVPVEGSLRVPLRFRLRG